MILLGRLERLPRKAIGQQINLGLGPLQCLRDMFSVVIFWSDLLYVDYRTFIIDPHIYIDPHVMISTTYIIRLYPLLSLNSITTPDALFLNSIATPDAQLLAPAAEKNCTLHGSIQALPFLWGEGSV